MEWRFFWILPDSPSGISIFYCPKTKSLNSSELERERNLALLDKVNTSDIEKLAKQKVSLPTTLMDLVWTIQNFLTILVLWFGPTSHSAFFLQGWVNHIYNNRLLYSSLQSSDPYFYAKVMFTMDNALQYHWHSCSSAADHSSVKENILRMSDIQESILRLNFNQMLPKSISEKVLLIINMSKDDKDKGNGLGKNDKWFPGANQDNKDKQNVIYNNDKNHQHWKVKENENFSKTFYSQQKDCNKTSDGKMICLNFFLRGVCVKSCNRVHSLNAEDKKKDSFVTSCREIA